MDLLALARFACTVKGTRIVVHSHEQWRLRLASRYELPASFGEFMHHHADYYSWRQLAQQLLQAHGQSAQNKIDLTTVMLFIQVDKRGESIPTNQVLFANCGPLVGGKIATGGRMKLHEVLCDTHVVSADNEFSSSTQLVGHKGEMGSCCGQKRQLWYRSGKQTVYHCTECNDSSAFMHPALATILPHYLGNSMDNWLAYIMNDDPFLHSHGVLDALDRANFHDNSDAEQFELNAWAFSADGSVGLVCDSHRGVRAAPVDPQAETREFHFAPKAFSDLVPPDGFALPSDPDTELTTDQVSSDNNYLK